MKVSWLACGCVTGSWKIGLVLEGRGWTACKIVLNLEVLKVIGVEP